MPIEVRELIIKATIQQENGLSAAAETKGGNNSISSYEEIIRTCIEEIVEIIKKKYER